MNIRSYLSVAVLNLLWLPVGSADNFTVTLSSVTPEYHAQQPATVTTTLQRQEIHFDTKVKLQAAATPATDTRSFSSATEKRAKKEATLYLRHTYCASRDIESAVITVRDGKSTLTTSLHPSAVTRVSAQGTLTAGSTAPTKILIRVKCPVTEEEG